MNAKDKKMIENYFGRMHRITESSRENAEELVKMNAKEERAHRKVGASFTDGKAAYNAPINITAEYFTVKQIFDGLTITYTAADYGHIRPSILFAAGIAHYFRAKINAEFTPAEISAFAELDYCELIK